jgi:hypothetical protein
LPPINAPVLEPKLVQARSNLSCSNEGSAPTIGVSAVAEVSVRAPSLAFDARWRALWRQSPLGDASTPFALPQYRFFDGGAVDLPDLRWPVRAGRGGRGQVDRKLDLFIYERFQHHDEL